MQFTYTLPDTALAATWLWQCAHSRRIWLLDAPMGAGKTTLAAALARFLGSAAEASSPTYGLVHEYPVPEQEGVNLIAHMDWYRLTGGAAEATEAGIEEYLDRPGCLCLIEWPEMAEALLEGRELFRIGIEVLESGARRVTVEGE